VTSARSDGDDPAAPASRGNPTGPAPAGSAAAPRLYAMIAARVPLAVVFRRGPSDWWQVSRWDLDSGQLEAGAWFHGTLYPRRCDLSPDGQFLYYFALKGAPGDFLGGTYSAVSKAPWLSALAAWAEVGTWGRGYHFAAGRDRAIARVDIGSLSQLPYSLRVNPAVQYAAERRRGWSEHETCPPRAPDDAWDERRQAVLAKPRPGGGGRLILTDHGWDPAHAIEGRHPTYRIEGGRHPGELDDVVWADWDARGRLLVATAHGTLEMRGLSGRSITVDVAHDLAPLAPAPAPAPEWATRW
jgi:hypothetical protein